MLKNRGHLPKRRYLTRNYIKIGVRTLQEEFIVLHLNLLSEDIDEFNRKLMDYLLWYNAERPYKSLNNKSAEKSADYRGV